MNNCAPGGGLVRFLHIKILDFSFEFAALCFVIGTPIELTIGSASCNKLAAAQRTFKAFTFHFIAITCAKFDNKLRFIVFNCQKISLFLGSGQCHIEQPSFFGIGVSVAAFKQKIKDRRILYLAWKTGLSVLVVEYEHVIRLETF